MSYLIEWESVMQQARGYMFPEFSRGPINYRLDCDHDNTSRHLPLNARTTSKFAANNCSKAIFVSFATNNTLFRFLDPPGSSP